MGAVGLSFGLGPAAVTREGVRMLRVARADPGMNTEAHLDENLASASLLLEPEELGEIDAAASGIAVTGARLSEGLLSLSED